MDGQPSRMVKTSHASKNISLVITATPQLQDDAAHLATVLAWTLGTVGFKVASGTTTAPPLALALHCQL